MSLNKATEQSETTDTEEAVQKVELEDESRFLEELEFRIGQIPFTPETVSTFINSPSDRELIRQSKELTEHDIKLLTQVKENFNQIFLLAAIREKGAVVDFLIKCGVNVNVKDDNDKTAADVAWTKKNYKILLSLLKADSFFPDSFNISDLNEDDDAKAIKHLVERRNRLHELIKIGNVNDIKNFEFNEYSKLYLNTTNQSAAYIALKSEKFTIYAYLKSIGAEFGKDAEIKEMEKKFEFKGNNIPKENIALQEAMVQYFPTVPDAHIYYLLSKSRSHKPVADLSSKLEKYYRRLDEIPEVSCILKVIQYSDYLDIIFDFDEEEISKINPLVRSKCCSRGETVYELGRIFIAASLKKRKETETLGTIAHELTHMAMQILYENDCNPYRKYDTEITKYFQDFRRGIRKVTGDESKILLDAIDNYDDPKDWDLELIVRIPHILAQCDNGRNWLETQIPKFFNFYKKKILPKCLQYIDESVILKPKSMVKSINESLGEINKFKLYDVFFENAPDLFQNHDKNIFVHKVENTTLGALKVLQGLYGKNYTNFYGYFLVLKFENFFKKLDEILKAFFSEGCKWLIIEISSNPKEDDLFDVCENFAKLLGLKSHKKIIFVVQRNVPNMLWCQLQFHNLLKFSIETSDGNNLSLDHFDQNSQKQILNKLVKFEGGSILLRELIKVPELYKFVTPEIIVALLEGRAVHAENDIMRLGALRGLDAPNIFLTAVKCGNLEVVDFLIKCGANVNASDSAGKTAADYAWENKNHKILFLLLKADSFFPIGFNFDALSKEDANANKIIKLIDHRNHLHEMIKSGRIDDVLENFKFNKILKLYLNHKNESAAYTALKSKKINVYAFLKSIGADLADDAEKSVLENFKLQEKIELQEAMVPYFPSVNNAHIYYLVSKSRSQKPVENLNEKLENYYRKLDEIPEISIILKILQNVDYLDIIYDFDEKDVSKVNPLNRNRDRDIISYKIGRIYIALKERNEKEILGSIAHQFTHMAMQILYENDCNPYGNSDEDIMDFFRDFKKGIRKVSGDFAKTLLDAIEKYEKSDHDSELIVRVPLILAQNGRDWLEKQIPDLFNFYKETIVPKCQKYLDESVILKPKSIIKSINESIGEIVKLKNCNIFFKNPPNFCPSKKIFMYKVENTFLGSLKVLQGLYGKWFANFHSNFLVLKLKPFVNQLTEIGQAFLMEGCKWLIIDISHSPTEFELDSVCDVINELLKMKPHKRIVFVTHRHTTATLRLNSTVETLDEGLSFDHLDPDSQAQISKKTVMFQGKVIMLKMLIQTEELYKYINPGIIESLLEGKQINIGSKILALSSLEGPYADVGQKMDFRLFIHHVRNTHDIFIIRSKQSEEVVEYFNSLFKNQRMSNLFFANKTYDFGDDIRCEKIFFVNNCFTSRDFKNFGKALNSIKKYFLIDVEDLNLNLFNLREIYNPNIYVERKYKRKFVEYEKMEDLVNKNRSETFLIYYPIVKNIKNSSLTNYGNVKWLNEEAAKNQFRSSIGIVHLFQMKDECFIWKNSHGSLTNLRSFFREEKNNENSISKLVLEERDLISKITDRKILLIAGNPGTGKTTTLTKLYEDRQISNDHWIIRINLGEHSDTIVQYISDGIHLENIVLFLQEIEPDLKQEFNENLLRTILTENQSFKCLLIAFDGFDEIWDEDNRKNIIDLLRFLKHDTPCKIWITSRFQHKDLLEDALDTIAVEFYPFDHVMQKSFIENYLKDRLRLTVNQKLFVKISVFTEHILTKMQKIFKEDDSKFVETPLYLNLMMSGSIEYFKQWAEREEQVPISLHYLGRNLLEILENFINKIYSMYFKKFEKSGKNRLKRDKEYSEKYNKNLSESLIYAQKNLKPKYPEVILSIGLVVSYGNVEFIHITFRDYYFAKAYAEYFLSKEIPSEFDEKIKFLFEEIFVKKEFQKIRNFLNLQFEEKIPKVKTEKITTFFLQGSDGRIMKGYKRSDLALNVASKERNGNIFKFIKSVVCSSTERLD